MDPDVLFRRYQELQGYVGWNEENAALIKSVASIVEPHLPALVDDFYAEIERHPNAQKVITGGAEQIQRLKGTLVNWLRELFAGVYDRDYVYRRWRVGLRHVEIGLDQVYTNVALSRLRQGLLRLLEENWNVDARECMALRRNLNMLLDLDLAIIEDAYQCEFSRRQQRMDRLAAIGQIAGGVAHELRNPLNVIRTSVYYLLNARNPTPQKTSEHLHRIEQQVLLADGVITALSRFAKMPLPNLHNFEVLPLIQEILESQPVPQNVRVKVDSSITAPQALGDKEQLRIVVSNLIRNACEAMSAEGGDLTIAVHPGEDTIEISVTDTGTGISPEHLNRLTEPLYSTKARGLGLGLAMAKSILEKNNSSLHVTSELGKGSTFTVRLQAPAGT